MTVFLPRNPYRKVLDRVAAGNPMLSSPSVLGAAEEAVAQMKAGLQAVAATKEALEDAERAALRSLADSLCVRGDGRTLYLCTALVGEQAALAELVARRVEFGDGLLPSHPIFRPGIRKLLQGVSDRISSILEETVKRYWGSK